MLSTSGELENLDEDKPRGVSDQEWIESQDILSDLAQFDPSLNLE